MTEKKVTNINKIYKNWLKTKQLFKVKFFFKMPKSSRFLVYKIHKGAAIWRKNQNLSK